MFTYRTSGTCSQSVSFDVDKSGRLHDVKFQGGCRGNTQGVQMLAEGRDLDEVENLLSGIQCRNGTSCPDQLAKAIAAYKRTLR